MASNPSLETNSARKMSTKPNVPRKWGDVTFPTEGILPKQETGAAAFISANKDWDGRGIRVAIFDTGVDPGSAGLQVTSDGKPKILDVVDCTGSGDVDTSDVKELKDGITITGLTGRTLTLGKWATGLKEVHLGIKMAYELFPNGLTKRVKAERKTSFMENQSAAMAHAQSKMAEWDAVNKTPSEEKKREKKDLEAVLDTLKEAAEQYADAGPVFDCVVFHDGSTWRAVIDSDGTGDLTASTPLCNYRDERQYSTIKTVPGCKEVSLLLNYCVTIYEEGKRLSIVCDAGAHGTHVAGIVAANFPESPELNGVAPGAQIVSCKIGDSRLGSMETGVGLVRALIAARDNGCQLINMSYGESFIHEKGGRFAQLASEFVERYGIMFISSAGNNGPALTTVGAPGGTCSALISVGAYVSPGMMEVEYSLREPLPSTNYTWSSRGPAPDGHMGVCIVAPGGAIAPVPTWTLQGKQLMNGTSMSSPNCCGGIALILSALKAQGIAHTPAGVRRAIENSAAQVAGIEPWALGTGLLQVPAAHTLLTTQLDSPAANITINATIPARNGARGLYLRDPAHTESITSVNVFAAPSFHVDCNNEDKVNFEVHVSLKSSAPWCVVPDFLVLNASGKGFDLVVDPATLPEGEASFCEVRGYDSKNPQLGPIFRFPVTAIKPKKLVSPSGAPGEFAMRLPERTYVPGTIDRHFIAVPEGATWAEITFKTREVEGSHMLVLHALQVLPSSAPTGRNQTEIERYIRLKPFHTVTEKVACVGGVTVELCLCKWWASLDSVIVDVDIVFHGLQVSSTSLFIGGNEPVEMEVCAPLRAEDLKVTGKITTLRKALVPSKHVFRQPMDARNTLPQQRYIYELELSYAFEQTEKEAVKVLPRPPMYELLYDSPFEAQMWMVYDSNKQLMGSGDALYPYPMTLPKGKYTMQLLVRHDTKALLDKLKNLVVPVDFTLAKELVASVHSSMQEALIGGDKYSGGPMARGSRVKVFVSPPTDKAPGGKHGDVLVGMLKVGCGEAWSRGTREECSLQVLVPKDAAKDEAKKDDNKDKTDAELEKEEIRDARLKRLKKLREDKKYEAFDLLATALVAEFPSHLPLLEELMSRRNIDGEDGETGAAKSERCALVLKAAEAIVAAVDTPALAAHYGVKHDSDDPAVKDVCKEMDKKKEALISALQCRVERFTEMLAPAPSFDAAEGVSLSAVMPAGKEAHQHLAALWGGLQQWWVAADQGHDEKMRYARLLSQVRRREARPGAAGAELLKMLKSNEGAPNKKVLNEFISLCDQMEWHHWTAHYKNLLLKQFPPKQPLI